MSISPPAASVRREIGRRIYLAAIAGIPFIGSPYAALLSVLRPGKDQMELERWYQDVTDRLNAQEKATEFFSRSVSVSEDAAFLGKWMAEQSKSGGRFDLVGYDEIIAHFPTATKSEVLDAIGELEVANLIDISYCLGKPFSHVRPRPRLFEVFDPIIFDGVSPLRDATLIARALLDDENSRISGEEICEQQGWSPRRFNPAVAIVGKYIDEKRKSAPMGQPFVVQTMFAMPPERARLRAFLEQVREA